MLAAPSLPLIDLGERRQVTLQHLQATDVLDFVLALEPDLRVYDDGAQQVTLWGPGEALDRAEKQLARVDQAPRWKLRAHLLKLTESGRKVLGINGQEGLKFNVGMSHYSPFTVSAIIQFLETQNEATLLERKEFTEDPIRFETEQGILEVGPGWAILPEVQGQPPRVLTWNPEEARPLFYLQCVDDHFCLVEIITEKELRSREEARHFRRP